MEGFITSDFDVFASKPVQTSVLETLETQVRSLNTLDQLDFQFLLPPDPELYTDPNIGVYVKGKLCKEDGSDFSESDHVCVTNNFLHSLFSQCSVYLNGVPISRASDNYHYRSFFETLLTYGRDAASNHLTNAGWYLDGGDLQAAEPTTSTNTGFVARWNRMKQSKTVELFGRLHTDLASVSSLIIPGVRIQVRLTRSKSRFYLLSKDADAKGKFVILDARIFVNRVRASPPVLLAHSNALNSGCVARYPMTRVELKTFTFSAGSQSLSVDNAVLGPLPKRLFFCIVKNVDFLGAANTNPYNFRHYDLTHFVLYMNGKQYPSEGGLSVDMTHEKGSVLGYRTLF